VTEPHLCAMADINAIDPQGPTETPELIRAAQDKAENAILLWQDIEFHLIDAKDKISKIRQTIKEFDLRQAARRD